MKSWLVVFAFIVLLSSIALAKETDLLARSRETPEERSVTIHTRSLEPYLIDDNKVILAEQKKNGKLKKVMRRSNSLVLTTTPSGEVVVALCTDNGLVAYKLKTTVLPHAKSSRPVMRGIGLTSELVRIETIGDDVFLATDELGQLYLTARRGDQLYLVSETGKRPLVLAIEKDGQLQPLVLK